MPDTTLLGYLLERFSGAEYVFSIVLLLAATWAFRYLGGLKPNRKQLLALGAAAVLWLIGIGGHRLWEFYAARFPKDVAGILVPRIKGDDRGNSLQQRLVSTLDAALASEAPEVRMQVHACDKAVVEDVGLTKAHESARKVGRKYRAMLVLWGNGDAAGRFFPRLTVVDERPPTEQERTYGVLDIRNIELPSMLVSEPAYLAHFVAGFARYGENQYGPALAHFEAALRWPVPGERRTDVAAIHFFAGACCWLIAQGQSDMAERFDNAIDHYTAVLEPVTKAGNAELWAATQNNLGNAYSSLPTGDRAGNLRKAIDCHEAALRVRTQDRFPVDWAMTQNNLGAAYAQLPTGDRAGNLRKAIDCYEAALRVYTEKSFPGDWAMTQNNLGNAYADLLQAEDRVENLRKAIGCYTAVLRVYTEAAFPYEHDFVMGNLRDAQAELDALGGAAD